MVYVKSKNQPYPIWIRFVRVRHTGVYRHPSRCWSQSPTRTFNKMVGVTGLAPAASWLQIRPSPNWQYTPNKLAGDEGIEPPQGDSKSPALPLCKSPVENLLLLAWFRITSFYIMWSYMYCFTTLGFSCISFSCMWWSIWHIFPF